MQATINHKNGNSLLWRPSPVFTAAVIFRILLLVWGDFQDARSPVKYTDIDYNVFTDASQFLAAGKSPYERATYRYTPLLAWLLLPTTSSSIPYAFAFGKIVFALSDIFAGWLILSILTSQGMPSGRALQFASIWLLNPMVANISTRGSSEGLLAVVVLGVLWSTLRGHHIIAGSLLGIAVHLKIYPFVYGLALFWSLRGASNGAKQRNAWFISWRGVEILNEKQLWLAVSSVSAFMGLNIVMYQMYVTKLCACSLRPCC